MLRIDVADEQALRWWANRTYESEMGVRSGQARIQTALEHGVASLPKGSGDVTERRLLAATRLREFENRLTACSRHQRLILACAFEAMAAPSLNAYGQYPRAVLGCIEAHRAFETAESSPAVTLSAAHAGLSVNPALPQWLSTLQERSRSGKKPQRPVARLEVERLRQATEMELKVALMSFGAGIEGVSVPKSLSMAEIAQNTGLTRPAIANRIKQLGVRRFCRRDGHRVLVQDLLLKWPEAVHSREAA